MNDWLDKQIEKLARRYKGILQGSGASVISDLRDLSFEMPNRSKAIRLVNACKKHGGVCYAHWMFNKEDGYSVWIYYKGHYEWKSDATWMNAKQFKKEIRAAWSAE